MLLDLGQSHFNPFINVYSGSNQNRPNQKGITFIESRELLRDYSSFCLDDTIFILDEFQERKEEHDYLFTLFKNEIKNKKRMKMLINTLRYVPEDLKEEFGSKYPKVEIDEHPFKIDIVYRCFQSLDTCCLSLMEVLKEIKDLEQKNEKENEITDSQKNNEKGKHILVFFPTYQTMMMVVSQFSSNQKLIKQDFGDFELFVAREKDNMKQVLKLLNNKNRIIIFSIKIFQTTLTLNHLKYVVDFGFTKRKIFDSKSCCYTREVGRISKQIAAQRMGRLGRTSNGRCFRMFGREEYEEMSEDEIPAAKLNYTTLIFLKAVKLLSVIKFGQGVIENGFVKIDNDFFRNEWVYKLEEDELKIIRSTLIEFGLYSQNNLLKLNFEEVHIGLDFQEFALFEFSKELSLEKEVQVYSSYIKTIRPLVLKTNTLDFLIAQKKLADIYFDESGDLSTFLNFAQQLFIDPNIAKIKAFCNEYKSTVEMINRFLYSVRCRLKTKENIILNLKTDTFNRDIGRLFLKVFYRNIVVKIPGTNKYYSMSWKEIVTISDDSFFNFNEESLKKLDFFIFLTISRDAGSLFCDFNLKIEKSDLEVIPVEDREKILTKISITGKSEVFFINSTVQKMMKNYLLKNKDIINRTDIFLQFDEKEKMTVICWGCSEHFFDQIKTIVERFKKVIFFEKKEIIICQNDKQACFLYDSGLQLLEKCALSEFVSMKIIAKNESNYNHIQISSFFEKIEQKFDQSKNGLKIFQEGFLQLFDSKDEKKYKSKEFNEKHEIGYIIFSEKNVAKFIYECAKSEVLKIKNGKTNSLIFNDLEFEPEYFLDKNEFLQVNLQFFVATSLKKGYIQCFDNNIKKDVFKILEEKSDEIKFSLKLKEKRLEIFDISSDKITARDIEKIIIKAKPQLKFLFQVNLEYDLKEAKKQPSYWLKRLKMILIQQKLDNSCFNLTAKTNGKNEEQAIIMLSVKKAILSEFEDFFNEKENILGTQKVYVDFDRKLKFYVNAPHFKKYESLCNKIRSEVKSLLPNDVLKGTLEKIIQFPFEKKSDTYFGRLKIFYDPNKINTTKNDEHAKILKQSFEGFSIGYNPTASSSLTNILSVLDYQFSRKYNDFLIKHNRKKLGITVFGTDCEERAHEYIDSVEAFTEKFVSFTFNSHFLKESHIKSSSIKEKCELICQNWNCQYEVFPIGSVNYQLTFFNSIEEFDKKSIKSEFLDFLLKIDDKNVMPICEYCQTKSEIIPLLCGDFVCIFCLRNQILQSEIHFSEILKDGINCLKCKTKIALSDIEKAVSITEIKKMFEMNADLDIFKDFTPKLICEPFQSEDLNVSKISDFQDSKISNEKDVKNNIQSFIQQNPFLEPNEIDNNNNNINFFDDIQKQKPKIIYSKDLKNQINANIIKTVSKMIDDGEWGNVEKSTTSFQHIDFKKKDKPTPLIYFEQPEKIIFPTNESQKIKDLNSFEDDNSEMLNVVPSQLSMIVEKKNDYNRSLEDSENALELLTGKSLNELKVRNKKQQSDRYSDSSLIENSESCSFSEENTLLQKSLIEKNVLDLDHAFVNQTNEKSDQVKKENKNDEKLNLNLKLVDQKERLFKKTEADQQKVVYQDDQNEFQDYSKRFLLKVENKKCLNCYQVNIYQTTFEKYVGVCKNCWIFGCLKCQLSFDTKKEVLLHNCVKK